MNDIDFWNDIQEIQDLIVNAVLDRDDDEVEILRLDLIAKYREFRDTCPNCWEFQEMEKYFQELDVVAGDKKC